MCEGFYLKKSLFHLSKLDFMKNLIFVFSCLMVLLHGAAQA